MNPSDLKSPWYLKSWIFILVALLSFVHPAIALLIIPLILLRESKEKNYLAQAEELNRQELLRIYDTEKSIIGNAQTQAEELMRNAQSQADSLTRKSQQQLNYLTQQINYTNAEIEKKAFYIAEVDRIKAEIENLEKKFSGRQAKMDRLMSIYKSVDKSLKTYFKNLPRDDSYVLPLELIIEIQTLAPAVTLRLHNMEYQDLRKAFRANEKTIDETLARYEDRYTTKANRAIYQLMVLALRAELQNILYTLKYSKLKEATDKVKELSVKYLNIAQDGNRNISSTLVRFIGEIEPLFIDAVKIEYEYYVKREAARQEQLELRAQMREEAEERKRLEEQQKQMEQEEEKYAGEIKNIQRQIQYTQDKERIRQLSARVAELQSQMRTLESKKEEIVRLQMGKAGYVYIISNLGSFGNDVFKIGMTRRLDPQERVDELGGTSVPFKFDVHSFIFSQDAVKLESSLHAALNDARLNKVNLRKEFFKVSLDDIEKLVNEIEPSAPFNRTMVAEQYHQSLSMQDEQQETRTLH